MKEAPSAAQIVPWRLPAVKRLMQVIVCRQAQGSPAALEYEFRDGERVVVQISGDWPGPGYRHTAEVAPGEDDVLMLAITVGINRARDVETPP